MDDLVAIERAGWDALCAGTGSNFYGTLMTPDGVMVLADGSVFDRDEVAASLHEAPPWTSYAISGARSVRLGDDATALVYRADAIRPGVEFSALMTSCYVRREGDWRLAVYQQTAIG